MKNAHAVALGRTGGTVKSDRKTEAARLNGRKGGRPRDSYRGALTICVAACQPLTAVDRTEVIRRLAAKFLAE